MTNQQTFTTPHRKIWEVLINLPDGQRIKKDDLMEKIGLTNDRKFFSVIEELRIMGYQIGASKNSDNPGYFEKRTDQDRWNYHFATIGALHREIDRVRENTKAGFIEEYGEDFDFEMEELREDLRRNHKESEEELSEDGEGDDENGSC